MRSRLVSLVALAVGACGPNGQGNLPDAGTSARAIACPPKALAAGCTVGKCTVSAPDGTLPQGASLRVAEVPLPSALAIDAVGPSLCEIDGPDASSLAGPLTLAIGTDRDATGLTLFTYAPPGPSTLVPSREGQRFVDGLVAGPGQYGVTEAPAGWSLGGVAGIDVSSAADRASRLRAISSQPINAAYFDGTHFFLGSGPRVLVYDGLPSDPGALPRLVLGQPSLVETLGGLASSSHFDSAVQAIWSDGTHLAVATGARVLWWNQLPSSSYAPADLVLGQPSFSSDDPNHGGVSATSLSLPASIEFDGVHLVVGDALNHRALVWDGLPSAIDGAASSVIGQPSFSSSQPDVGAVALYQCWGATLVDGGVFVASLFGGGLQHVAAATTPNPAPDFRPVGDSPRVTPTDVNEAGGVVRSPSGGLAVRDLFGQRIAVFRAAPTGTQPIDFALGQPDLARTVTSPTSASTVAYDDPHLTAGGGLLLAPDGNRVLVWDASADYSFAPATRVYGQAGFTTAEKGVDYRGISAATLAGPADVAIAAGTLAVADRGNNRVLLFDAAQATQPPVAAQVVLGQPDAASYLPNVDQTQVGAATLSGPGGVALDGKHLIVSDTENHRVLIWNTLPTTSGQPADLVLGQRDFASGRPNAGRGDTSPRDGVCDTDLDGMFAPTGVASDGTRLVVADRLNHRVLMWRAFPSRNGQPADLALGQPDGTSNLPDRGGGPFVVAPDGFDLPTGVTLDGNSLWVADTENNRVVRWDGLDGAPAPAAFLGQPDGVTRSNPNFEQPTDANPGFGERNAATVDALLRPRAIAIARGRVWVSELDGNRVHGFDAQALAPVAVLGQADFTTSAANVSGPSPASLSLPGGLASDGTQLWIADAGNHRVLAFDGAATTGAAARALLGQPSYLAVGFNQTSSAAGSVTKSPHGLWRDGGDLFIADTGHHRVLVVPAPAQAGATPTRVYGQPDDRLALANAGGAPSASTLHAPHGVFADGTRVIVADTGNHRVLLYDRASATGAATLVLGQTDMTSVLPNRGGAPDAGTLDSPAGAFSDGKRLFVADTANHRVLVWTQLPTANGQPADLVLGQATMSDNSPNRGAEAPSARSLVFPTAILEIGGAILVADSGNNRVLGWRALPSGDPPADLVLGQPDAVSRTAAADPGDLTRMAGPVALTTDGTNLYVLERDMGRVLGWPAVAASALPTVALRADALGTSAPGGIAVDATAYFTSRLHVADSGNDRVLLVDGVTRLLGAR